MAKIQRKEIVVKRLGVEIYIFRFNCLRIFVNFHLKQHGITTPSSHDKESEERDRRYYKYPQNEALMPAYPGSLIWVYWAAKSETLSHIY
uniref:Uncharacterized protein n=1 Tax=Strigamia maritima TaxID=126957 RepID=T1IPU1_STRMM